MGLARSKRNRDNQLRMMCGPNTIHRLQEFLDSVVTEPTVFTVISPGVRAYSPYTPHFLSQSLHCCSRLFRESMDGIRRRLTSSPGMSNWIPSEILTLNKRCHTHTHVRCSMSVPLFCFFVAESAMQCGKWSQVVWNLTVFDHQTHYSVNLPFFTGKGFLWLVYQSSRLVWECRLPCVRVTSPCGFILTRLDRKRWCAHGASFPFLEGGAHGGDPSTHHARTVHV